MGPARRVIFGRALLPLIGLAIIPLLPGCPAEAHLSLLPGSTAEHLTVIVGPRRGEESRRGGISMIWFDHCTGSHAENGKVWKTQWSPRGEHYLSRIEYGVTPDGWLSPGPAPALTPGCYQATIGAWPGIVEFDVDSTGGVTERPEEDD